MNGTIAVRWHAAHGSGGCRHGACTCSQACAAAPQLQRPQPSAAAAVWDLNHTECPLSRPSLIPAGRMSASTCHSPACAWAQAPHGCCPPAAERHHHGSRRPCMQLQRGLPGSLSVCTLCSSCGAVEYDALVVAMRSRRACAMCMSIVAAHTASTCVQSAGSPCVTRLSGQCLLIPNFWRLLQAVAAAVVFAVWCSGVAA